jgi:hypothetical protein
MQAVLDAHRAVGYFLIASSALVGVWAVAAQYIEPLRVRALWWCVAVAQIVPFVSALLGVILVSRYDVELDQFHALYGFSAIIAVGILYSYRSSPFIKGKQYLLYGLGCLFIMGLGIRELYLHT